MNTLEKILIQICKSENMYPAVKCTHETSIPCPGCLLLVGNSVFGTELNLVLHAMYRRIIGRLEVRCISVRIFLDHYLPPKLFIAIASAAASRNSLVLNSFHSSWIPNLCSVTSYCTLRFPSNVSIFLESLSVSLRLPETPTDSNA